MTNVCLLRPAVVDCLSSWHRMNWQAEGRLLCRGAAMLCCLAAFAQVRLGLPAVFSLLAWMSAKPLKTEARRAR